MTTVEEIYLERTAQAAAKAHADTNHFYDGNLPYGFHLKLSGNVGKEFKHLLNRGHKSELIDSGYEDIESIGLGWEAIVRVAICWHDAIEDARLTYNDLKKIIGKKQQTLYTLSLIIKDSTEMNAQMINTTLELYLLKVQLT